MTNAKKVTAAYRELVSKVLSAASGHVVQVATRNGGKSHLVGLPGWSLVVRNHSILDLPGAVDEAVAAADNDGSDFYAAIMNRRLSKSVGKSYVILDLETFSKLIQNRARHDS